MHIPRHRTLYMLPRQAVKQAEGSVKTGFQAVTGGVTIQVWEDKFYLITRAVRAGSMTRLHFLTWTTLIMRRADSAKLGQSAKH